DRLGRRGHRILHVLAGVAPTRVLRRHRDSEQQSESERKRSRKCSRKATHVSANSFVQTDHRGADSMPNLNPRRGALASPVAYAPRKKISSRVAQRVTTIVTSSSATSAPSSARQRRM